MLASHIKYKNTNDTRTTGLTERQMMQELTRLDSLATDAQTDITVYNSADTVLLINGVVTEFTITDDTTITVDALTTDDVIIVKSKNYGKLVIGTTGDKAEEVVLADNVDILRLDADATTDGSILYTIKAELLDEANMTTNSAVKAPTQQSVKKYVDDSVATAVASEMSYIGGYDADTNTPNLDDTPAADTIAKGDMYTVTASGLFYTVQVEPGDILIAEAVDAAAEDDWTVVNKNVVATTTVYHTVTDANKADEIAAPNGTAVAMTVLYEGYPINEGTADEDYSRTTTGITLNTEPVANEIVYITVHAG